MKPDRWKFAFSSVMGTSHEHTGAPCQDASDCLTVRDRNGDEILIMIASDGAGSATRSQVSSSLACSTFVREVKLHFECGGEIGRLDREFAVNWLTGFQNELRLRSEYEGLTLRDFACTLLAAVLGDTCSVFLQVGDGVIVVPSRDQPDTYHHVFWPQRGEYANQTCFATDNDVTEKVLHDIDKRSIDEVAILTDGIEGLALNYAAMSIHTPFFTPLFSWLRTFSKTSPTEDHNLIKEFLTSERVNERTNDDKTLMLATRRVPNKDHAIADGASTLQSVR